MGLSDGEDGENSHNLNIALAPIFLKNGLSKHPLSYLPTGKQGDDYLQPDPTNDL
jgi:hypothetical protein